MENVGLWVTIIVIVLIAGSILNFRNSPRENALGVLRDKARKIGLIPRLIPAPEWTKLEKNGNYAQMVAYYSVLITDQKLPSICAIVQHQELHVVRGDSLLQGYPIHLKGAFAIELQANAVSIYWDESQDLNAEHLEDMKQYLLSLAQYVIK